MATTVATLFRAFLPVLMLKEAVVKIFQRAPQDSEMAKGSDVYEYHDAASDLSICESSESGEIEPHRGPIHNSEEEDRSKLHPHTEGEGHGTLKETVMKVFQQPPQDSEMVEGNGVDDDLNTPLDCFIRESLVIGESVAHCDSTHNKEQEAKSKPHPGTEGGSSTRGSWSSGADQRKSGYWSRPCSTSVVIEEL